MKNGIVFCNRKRDVDIVAKSLSVHGHAAAPIHGDLAQSLRMETLDKFKSGEVKLLVASDVAARGLDIPDVSHVFNYDVPNHSEDYVHRIGRTGRAGKEGDTIMLVSRLDEKNYQAILDLIKVEAIDELEIPGIEDFEKTGPRRKGNDRGRGKDRGRDRNKNRSRGGRDRDDSRRNEKPREDKPAAEKAPARKAAPGRRKAPSRRDDTSRNEETAKSEAPVRKEAPTRREAPKRDRDDSERAPRKSENKRPPKKDNASRSRSSNAKQGDKPKGRRGRNDLKENTVAGFGDDMPAFFGSKLK